MKNFRTYGKTPSTVAVIHGGPGVAGEMAPVAREISRSHGVLESFQTERTLTGQIAELKNVLENEVNLPVTLIGHSWGALLSFIVTAKYPALVKKLVLVSSGLFEDAYATGIMSTRLCRLSEEDRSFLDSLVTNLNEPKNRIKTKFLQNSGQLLIKPMPLILSAIKKR